MNHAAIHSEIARLWLRRLDKALTPEERQAIKRQMHALCYGAAAPKLLSSPEKTTMTTRLTQNQKAALEKLRDGKYSSAYALHASLGTLRSLQTRRLVSSKTDVGSVFSPATAIQWRITNEGLRAVREA